MAARNLTIRISDAREHKLEQYLSGICFCGAVIGVQIVGPYLEDRTTIAFASLNESEFGGFTPPPELKLAILTVIAPVCVSEVQRMTRKASSYRAAV
jgi:hypothetical protein